MDEDRFEPRIGRTREGDSQSYGPRLRAAAGGHAKGRRRKFHGTRKCRGSAAAHALMSPDRYAGLRSRRAFVNARVAYRGPTGAKAIRAHLQYMMRDNVGRDGQPGRLYSAEQAAASEEAFVGRCRGDRHRFWLMLSAEDSPDYDRLEPLVRRFMARMEDDLGTRLEWVAVDHFNTSQPHTHVVLRGKDELGEDLVIAPDYLKHGAKLRLEEIVSIDLGPEMDFENKRVRRLEIDADRLTSIDHRLLRDMDQDRVVAADGASLFDQALRTGRLRKLEGLGLAAPTGEGRWRLGDELEATLRALGEGLDAVERGTISRRPDLRAVLERREILRVAGDISNETGLKFAPAVTVSSDQVLRRRLDLACGQFAMIEGGLEFSLVPWQPEFDDALGRSIEGVARGEGMSWRARRDVGLEL